MVCPPAALRPAAAAGAWRSSRLALALLLGLAWAGGRPLPAQAGGWVPFPDPEKFRQVQLAAMACARDNINDLCSQSRQLADGLLDHPRLPASCKDVLWTIRGASVTAATNTYERREGLMAPARQLRDLCRSREVPSTAPKAKPEGGPGGINFGGMPAN